MNQIYRSTVPQEEKLRIGTLEPFDEFEVGSQWNVLEGRKEWGKEEEDLFKYGINKRQLKLHMDNSSLNKTHDIATTVLHVCRVGVRF